MMPNSPRTARRFVAYLAAALLAVGLLGGARAHAGLPCVGDCSGDRLITVDELVRGVNIVLGSIAVDECPGFDCNGTGTVTIDCLIQAVNAALDGCAPAVADPTLEGPISGGSGAPFVAATFFNLAQVGYQQAEYFYAGTATAYVNTGALGTDGRWGVEAGTSAAYKTRMLVYRPIDAAAFNGTVLVEWLNVSGGLDSAPDWISAHTELTRSGYVWVGVSAQLVGVEGGNGGILQASLKKQDPLRYGSLHHPGDSFSYDMYSQAAQALRHPAGIDPLAGLAIERVIAAGESQSAFRMVTYINAIHPLTHLFDGFLVHSRGGGSAALSEPPQTRIQTPNGVIVRDDVDVPVMIFQTETDVLGLGSLAARQPDSTHVRLWETAGTAHADTYTLLVGMSDLGNSPDVAKLVVTADPIPGIISCSSPLNSGPQHWVLKAAIAALDSWLRDGTAPPTAPRIAVASGPPSAIQRDANGNALGGIRTSYVDVPLATLSGEGQSGSGFCAIFGTTVPFDAEKLQALYPTHADYVAAVVSSTDAAVDAGFVLPPDGELIKTFAENSAEP
ncbi:MAG: alpha/beta hydrolase domain-containing protein [bacterium]